jgi:hypothetical protein
MSGIRTKTTLLMTWLLLLPGMVRGQAPLSNLVVTVGTTIQDSSGHNWSYVLLGAPQGQLLLGKRFAIYGKNGYSTNTGVFTLRGTIFQQTDPNAATTLLNQSVALGEDLTSLGSTLNTLLHGIPGITNENLGQKVVTAFQTAATTPDTANFLGLVAHVNPGLTMCAGQAFSEVITTVTTYEVREVNLATGVAGDVIGRVTVIPGSPIVLPAPGFPFQVTTNDPSDNLRIRLRWGTPNTLRRLSLLSYGYNVWRIPLSNAVASGYTNVPPTITQLYSDPNFTLANHAPVVAIKDFTTGHGAGAADDPADRTTYFMSDNNGALSGGTPFVDGQQFFYFVTARDVLGRDGLPSPGGMAEAFRRNRPAAPAGVAVKNIYHVQPTNQQYLAVSWVENTNANDLVNQYWVYRWQNPSSYLTNDATPSNNVIGVVTQGPGGTNSYNDNGSNAPLVPGLSNYWYTVRAVSIGAAGPLLSPHSMPAWGVLRERFGPVATTGSLVGSCGTPVVIFEDYNSITNAAIDTNHWLYRFTCQRRDPGTAWAEFFVTNELGDGLVLGPVYFPPSGDTLSVDYAPSIIGTNFVATVACEVGSFYGLTSVPWQADVQPPAGGFVRQETVFLSGEIMLTSLSSSDPLYQGVYSFQRCLGAVGPKAYPDGTVRMQFDTQTTAPLLIQAGATGPSGLETWSDVGVAVRDPNGFYSVSYPACLLGALPPFRGCPVRVSEEGGCTQHISSGAANGPVNPIQISFLLTPRTHEYRLYRTVNDGPRTMIAQSGAVYSDTDPYRNILATDDTMPPSAAHLCYYVQLLDEHGNPSPMTLIGCKDVKPAQLPRPVLAQPQPIGTSSSPQVQLNWYCPTNGVYRFQVLVQRADNPGGSAPLGFSGLQLAPLLTYNKTATYLGLLDHPLELAQFDAALLSPPVQAAFGPGPQFTTTAAVLANVPYHISVAAVDDQGNAGEPSEVWNFTWVPTNPLPVVPWPARPIPPVNVFDDAPVASVPPVFVPRVQAVIMYNGNRQLDLNYPVGIRIGDGRPVGLEAGNIGTTNFLSYQISSPFGAIPLPPPPTIDPNNLIFRRVSANPSRNGDSLLPIAVYRMQVANTNYPLVSGALTQVTPLLEQLAFGLSGTGNTHVVTIYDLLIGGGQEPEGDYVHAFIYLRDQQPVLLGASYAYFVARFNSQHEVSEIIPAGTVTLPSP